MDGPTTFIVGSSRTNHAEVLYIETVADPHLQIKGGGDGHPNPEIRGRARPKKNYFFGLSRLSLAPRAPPLDPPLVNSCIL